MRRLILAAAVAGAVTVVPATARAQEPFPGLDAYIAKAVEQWKVPGLSVAIVRNDSVIYTKGFGVLVVGEKTPVDAQTLFEIGSSSKAFTATLVSMLVADGKMRYDDRLTTYLPDFRMYDPVANTEVTVRDALTHRSGIARGEFVWLGSGFTRDEVLHHVRFLKPEAPFRSHYSYQNMMFLAAGQAAGKAGGSTWDELVKTRIFQPVGMTSTITDYHNAGPNSAKPHGMAAKDSVFVQPFMNGANIGPAGSILSNARDMARWLRFQLANGMIDGKRLVAAGPFRETHTPQILMTGAPEAGMRAAGDSIPLTHFSAYGMGWIIEDYRNHLMWQHGGNTIGSTAAVGMLPEDKFGVVVLSSMGSAQLPGILMHYIFDRQIGAPMKDLSGEALARMMAQRRRADSAQVAQAGAAKPGAPPVALAAFAGTFADSLYGEATVTVEGDHLVMHRGEWTGKLEYQNALNFNWNLLGVSPLPSLPIKFDAGPDGKITGLYFGIGGDVMLLSRKAPAGGRGGRGGNP